MNIKNFFALLIIFVLFSCSNEIDSTSDESYKSSLEAIKKDLSEDDKQKFENALKKIALEDMNDFSDLANFNAEEIRKKLDGMTYDDVIKEGNRIQKKIDKKNKEQAKIEIEELYSKKQSSKRDSIELSKFKVEKSRFYKRKSGTYIISYDPIIDITVFNGTDHPVSRAYFTGTIKSPDRTIPWLVEDFNYTISGGLEPNERSNWKLAPNSFSDWGTVEVPKDAIFTVTVNKLDGADGEKLFSIDFDEDDKERLNELLEDYPEFKQ